MRHTLPIALLLLTACPSGVTVPVEDEDMAELDQDESTERDMRGEEDAPLDMRVEADAAPACECEPLEVCVEGACEAAPTQLTIEIDGVVVYQTADVQLQYVAGQDALLAAFPSQGDEPFQVLVQDVALGPGATEECTTPTSSANAAPSAWPVHIPQAPAPWVNFGNTPNCDIDPTLDAIDYRVDMSEVSAGSLGATFELTVAGAGERVGSTLRAYGRINATTR